MSEKKDWKVDLVKKYPRMYAGMLRGFECDSGWKDILEQMSADLQMVIDCLTATKKPITIGVRQIKEKLGLLVVYYDLHMLFSATKKEEKTIHNIVKGVVRNAEDDSSYTCEICGRDGGMFGTYRLKTLCSKHGDAYNKQTLEQIMTDTFYC